MDVVKEIQIRSGLRAPRSYWHAPLSKRRANCNGCGTEGWKGALVPDTIWGLPISAACDIHDWQYAEGDHAADKDLADVTFFLNLLALIRRAADASVAGWVLKLVRQRRAFTYYQAVSESPLAEVAFHEAKLI